MAYYLTKMHHVKCFRESVVLGTNLPSSFLKFDAAINAADLVSLFTEIVVHDIKNLCPLGEYQNLLRNANSGN